MMSELESVKSYLLRITDHVEFSKMVKSAKFVDRYQHRALLVTAGSVPTSMIVQSFNGDISGDPRQWYSWVHSNIIEELHAVYLTQAPVPQSVYNRAVKRWQDAKEAINKAEDDQRKAIKREQEACKGLIKANGLGPLVFDGTTYDPAYYVLKNGDEVIRFLPRKLKNRFDTF